MSQLSAGKKATFTGVLVLGVFALAEIVVRITKPHTDLWADTGRAVGPDPKSTWANLDAFSAYVARPGSYAEGKTVNDHGFISTPAVARDKPAGTTRVAFIGGSSTAGTGSDPLLTDAETWPWLATDLLRARQPERTYDFLNCGQSGFTTFEGYGRLWSRVRFYRPDVLVLYHGWNDLWFFRPGAVDGVHRWRVREDGNWGLYMQLEILEPSWVDHLIWWSQLLCKLRWKIHGPIGGELGLSGSGPLSSEIDLAYQAVWREHLQLYQAAAELLGAELFVCKQATLIVPNSPESDRQRILYGAHGFDHDALVRAYQAFYDVIDDEIPADRIIDTTSLSGRSDLFLDHVHPNPAGAEAIASLVAEHLERELYGRE